ncbi:hypothetical protein MC885_015850 [Smutsia gigantea]|nr:hypothetical protein MC885_015850 [Smutsia gigantea]
MGEELPAERCGRETCPVPGGVDPGGNRGQAAARRGLPGLPPPPAVAPTHRASCRPGDHKVELQRNSALRASATRNGPRGGCSQASLLQPFIAPGGPPPTGNPRISP